MIEEEYKRSIILDSNFTSIIGKDASVLLADTSPLFVHGTRILENEAAGSTLGLTNLRAMFNNTIFYENVARQGGGIYVKDRSELNITDCTFARNKVDLQAAALMIES